MSILLEIGFLIDFEKMVAISSGLGDCSANTVSEQGYGIYFGLPCPEGEYLVHALDDTPVQCFPCAIDTDREWVDSSLYLSGFDCNDFEEYPMYCHYAQWSGSDAADKCCVCNATMRVMEERCGNGNIDNSFNEQCDDGNEVSGDGCSDTCVLEYDASTIFDQLDSNNDQCISEDEFDASVPPEEGLVFETFVSIVSNDGCPEEISEEDFDAWMVKQMACGNRTRDYGEECDDGNNDPADGCSVYCSIENGYTCDTDTPNLCLRNCSKNDTCPTVDDTFCDYVHKDYGYCRKCSDCSDCTCQYTSTSTAAQGQCDTVCATTRRSLLRLATEVLPPSAGHETGSRNSPAGGGGGEGRGRNAKGMRPKRTKFTREDRLEEEARRRGRNENKMRPRPTEYKTGGGAGRRAEEITLSEDGQCMLTSDWRGPSPVIFNEETPDCFGDHHCTLTQNSGAKVELVASVWQSTLPDPPTISAKIYLLSPKKASSPISAEEALRGCGVSEAMGSDTGLTKKKSVPKPGLRVRGSKKPFYSTFAGKLGSLLRVDFQSAEPAVGVNLELQIDNATFPVWRRRGGCYDYDHGDISVTLCLRGKIGLYEFDADNRLWQKDGQEFAFFYPWEEGMDFWQVDSDGSWSIDFHELKATVHPFSNTTREFEALSDIFERADDNVDDVIDEDEYEALKYKVFATNVTSSSTWAALATSPCSDYNGTGVAGGEKVTILPWVDYGSVYTQINGEWVQEPRPKIVMGNGVFSRKPGLALTNRPAFKSIGDVVASRAVGSMPTSTPMKLRSNWHQLCPEQDQTSCEGNVASLGWCADITFTWHCLMNARVLCVHP